MNKETAKKFFSDGKYLIPESLYESLERYVDVGIPPGSFTRAVLENNFLDAVIKADGDNIKILRDIGMFIKNYMPTASYGSPVAVENWISHKGLEGLL